MAETGDPSALVPFLSYIYVKLSMYVDDIVDRQARPHPAVWQPFGFGRRAQVANIWLMTFLCCIGFVFNNDVLIPERL